MCDMDGIFIHICSWKIYFRDSSCSFDFIYVLLQDNI